MAYRAAVEELAAVRKDADTRVQAAESCSLQWMRERDTAIKARTKVEAQLQAIGHKTPLYIHAGDHCPFEAENAALKAGRE